MPRREWTAEEEKYMTRYYLWQSTKRTADYLGRSIPSVKHKAAKLGLNAYCNDNLSAKTIAKCFNVDVSVILRWIQKLNLPASKVRLDNQTRYIIMPENFWKWAEEHKDAINWSGYEIMSILPEPSWVEMEKKNYQTKRSCKKFTDNEIVQIKHMLHKGRNYREIATEMKRSYWSISHVCRNLY